MVLTSDAFAQGEAIPMKYACDGDNVSPPLAWSDIPASARSLALIVDDPDAPSKTWVHWVIYAIAPASDGLPEAVPATEETADGARQSVNDFRKIGYGGPCPPKGSTHQYFFRLSALDAEPSLPPGATKQQTLDAMEGHIVARAELIGTYSRR